MIVAIQVSREIAELETVRFNEAMPVQLSSAYQHTERVAREKGFEVGLYSLGFSFIPMFFQYSALLFASDYVNHTIEPRYVVSDSLEVMVTRSSVGKWHAFSITYTKALLQESATPQSPLEAFARQYRNAAQTKGPWTVSIIENDANSQPKRLSLLEFLLVLRNRLAHRNGQVVNASEIFDAAEKVLNVKHKGT